MAKFFRAAMKRRLKHLVALATLLLTTAASLMAACTATEKNADYSVMGSGTSASVNANINAVGDLVAITAWCYTACSPVSVKLGSQTAIQTSVSGLPGLGSPGTGQGFIFYVLSAGAAGSQTLTFTATGGATQTQVSYIDFTATGGCSFSHDTDSSLGSFLQSINGTGNPGTINAPSISANPGDVLFNFTWSSEHVNDINSPWSCPTYSGSGETGDCQFVSTRNVAAYILSAPSGSVSNNTTDTHDSDLWQALLTSFSMSGGSSGTGGTSGCPSTAPVSGNNCFFIAANGSDSNSGTSESSPWQHAPGMPNCTANCAANNPVAGEGFIFRGGDTWHFGNKTPSGGVYTGGTWAWHGSGTGTNCDTVDDAPNPVGTTCVYIGVDKTWFTGSSWARPIMNNDNPTSTTAVSSCPYPNVGGFLGGYDETFVMAGVTFVWVDNFEWTGQCNASSSQGGNIYIHERVANSTITQNRYSNNYFHGFTHLAFNCPATLCEANEAFTVSIGSTIGPGNVCDGWDSDPASITCLTPGGGGWLTYDNVWANQAQIVANGCHIWHDNYWFGYTFSGDGVAHGNQWECNNSAPQKDSNGHVQPSTTHNLFYNNVVGHNTSGTGGDIKLQFAVNSTYPWYVFNNVIYDQGSGNQLNWGGTGVTLPTGTQKFFNNTFEAATAADIPSCYAGMDYENNYIVAEGGTYFAGPGGCTTSHNVGMSHATAVSQGYMTNGKGTSGNNSNITCANDVTPCAPTALTNSTVNQGDNVQTLCANLLASSDSVIQRAGTACQSGTTDSCTYNTSARSVSCPRVTPVARPTGTTWDAGASQFANSQTQTPQPPTDLQVTVQ